MSGSAEEKRDIHYDSDFFRIEELIQGNSFSSDRCSGKGLELDYESVFARNKTVGDSKREEISRLVEILNSRVDDEKEKQKASINVEGDTPLVSWTNKIQTTPLKEKDQDIDRTTIGTFHQNSDVSMGVGASPIDIARAYMASRSSEGGLDHDYLISKCERALPSSEFTQKQLLPSPCPKPSIYWPGAMVHDPHGYATPQSQRGRHRLHNFPRTPYSKTTLQKSTTKLQAENRYPYTSTPFQSSQTSLYDQVKSRGNNVDGYGSVGPIRRIRNKFASEIRPRGSIFPTLSTDTPTRSVTPRNFGGFLPSTEKNQEPGETSGTLKLLSGDKVPSSSNCGVSSSHLSSSHAVRKILEHLDRNKPTPKEKDAELKLVTSWRRSSFEDGDTIHKKNSNSVHIGELSSHKNTTTAEQNMLEEVNKSKKYNFSMNHHDKGTDEATNAVNGTATASNLVSTGFNTLPGGNLLPLFGHTKTSGPVVEKLNESTSVAATNHGQNQMNLHFPHPQPSDGQDVTMTMTMAAAQTGYELSKDNAIKPSLPSISIKKPDFRTGFTFPVSASSGVLSELPTPSITPPSSASLLSQPSAAGMPTELPSYSFGTNKTSTRLVFSFPTTSSAPANDDSDLKFNFGSDKNKRKTWLYSL